MLSGAYHIGCQATCHKQLAIQFARSPECSLAISQEDKHMELGVWVAMATAPAPVNLTQVGSGSPGCRGELEGVAPGDKPLYY